MNGTMKVILAIGNDVVGEYTVHGEYTEDNGGTVNTSERKTRRNCCCRGEWRKMTINERW